MLEELLKPKIKIRSYSYLYIVPNPYDIISFMRHKGVVLKNVPAAVFQALSHIIALSEEQTTGFCYLLK